MSHRLTACLTLALLPALAGPLLAEAHMSSLSTELTGADGTNHGSVTVAPTASGEMLIELSLTDLPEGEHAIHIHETGDCSAEDFSSAGGHLADGREHGVMVEGGPHPGDMPNIVVGPEGTVDVTLFNAHLTPDLLGDADGSAVILHAGADDYQSQPAGDAGDRLACGVLAAPQ